jgi:hypothetical protein
MDTAIAGTIWCCRSVQLLVLQTFGVAPPGLLGAG